MDDAAALQLLPFRVLLIFEIPSSMKLLARLLFVLRGEVYGARKFGETTKNPSSSLHSTYHFCAEYLDVVMVIKFRVD